LPTLRLQENYRVIKTVYLPHRTRAPGHTARLALIAASVFCLPQTALAQAAGSPPPSVAAQDPRAFVDDLAGRAFGILRNHAIPESERRRTFRAMLSDNFALQQIGDRLIRRHRATITPAQYAAYRAAFPGFVVGTYADRLEGFENASLKTTRAVPRGATGDSDVLARVTKPGRQPIDTVWAVHRVGDRWLIANVTVSGINLALTQEADFDSYIQRQGFDALVAFMKKTPA